MSAIEEVQADRKLRPEPRAVLIRDFADVALPLSRIRGRFLSGGDWLAPLASRATADGEAVTLRVGPRWIPDSVGREVRVELGLVHFRHRALVVPLAWEAVEHTNLFPRLDGEVEVSSLADGNSRLTFSGSYTPPGGQFGARLDRTVLHRVASSTVRAFLNEVAGTLLREGSVGVEG